MYDLSSGSIICFLLFYYSFGTTCDKKKTNPQTSMLKFAKEDQLSFYHDDKC